MVSIVLKNVLLKTAASSNTKDVLVPPFIFVSFIVFQFECF